MSKIEAYNEIITDLSIIKVENEKILLRNVQSKLIYLAFTDNKLREMLSGIQRRSYLKYIISGLIAVSVGISGFFT